MPTESIRLFTHSAATARRGYGLGQRTSLQNVDKMLARLFQANVHPSAVVEPSARLGRGVSVGPNAYVGKLTQIGSLSRIGANSVVGDGVRLGRECQVENNVNIQNCIAGDRVVLKPGCSVGQDGFGFHPAGTFDKDKVVKKPQNLRVVLENDIEIGANSTIDRGSWRDTRIGEFSKLDNLVQVGHNVNIGRNCLIAAQTGIAGSVTIGDRVLIGGQTGIAQYVRIGDDCQIAAKSGVISDLLTKSKVGGMPAVDILRYHRSFLEAFPRMKKRAL